MKRETGKVDEWEERQLASPFHEEASRPLSARRPAVRPIASGLSASTMGSTATDTPLAAELVEWLARAVVPGLAVTGLISLPHTAPVGKRSGPAPFHHLLVRTSPDRRHPASITPVDSPALEQYPPIQQVALGEGQLWRLDEPLGALAETGASAIAVPLGGEPAGRGVLTLFRPPSAPGFALDDLLTLDELVSGHIQLTAPMTVSAGPTAVPPPPTHRFPLRYLLRDLLAADTPYEVAQRLARAAQQVFETQNCVVYFVNLVAGDDGATARAIAAMSRADDHPALQLAASFGSGVALTPPWLVPEAAATAHDIFASGPTGTVLRARFGDDESWIEHEQPEGDVLIGLPLRSGDELVAVLGLRRPTGLTGMDPTSIENFVYIAGLSLAVAQRRVAEQTSGLVLRSELARNRLAQDALVAMIGSGGILPGLEAHARVLVPGVADGYLVYLDPALLPEAAQQAIGLAHGPGTRVVSHWRSRRDAYRVAALERWVDERLAVPLMSSQATGEAASEAGGDHDRVPLFLSDAEPGQSLPSSSVHAGAKATVRSLAAIPLTHDQVVIGALVLVTTEHGRRYGRRDFRFIESLAEPVSQALMTLAAVARPHVPSFLPEWTGQSSGETTARLLAAVSAQLLSVDDLEAIGRTVTQALVSWRADWCVIELRGDDGNVQTIGAHADPDQAWPAHLWAHLSRGRASQRGPSHVMRTGQSDLSPTVAWAGAQRESARGGESPSVAPSSALAPTSSLSVAIGDAAGVVGVITCLRTDRTDPFSLEDLAVAETVAAATNDAVAAVRRLERERTENRRLHWLFAQHTRLMRQIADAVVAVDAQGQIVYANDAARALHIGSDLTGSIGDYVRRFRPVEIQGHPYDAQSFPLAVALASGRPTRGLWQMGSAAERVVLVGKAAPLRDDDGTLTGAVLSLHDATTEFVAAMNRQHQLLGLADELRPPMTSIKGWAQYLGQRTESRPDRPRDDRALEAITAQTRTLQRLVDQIAELARPQLVTADEAARVSSDPTSRPSWGVRLSPRNPDPASAPGPADAGQADGPLGTG